MNAEKIIGFVGAGQMAQALARGFVAAQLVRPGNILAHDTVKDAIAVFRNHVPEARAAENNRALVREADVVFLAIKPQHMAQVLEELHSAVTPEKLFVSIAAGISLSQLTQTLGPRVVRVMPNTPCLVGEGASGYSLASGVTKADGEYVGKLLSSLGLALKLDEKMLDVVTGLSGSGPAYAFVIIDALADGAVAQGLPREAALQLAAQTLRGAAEMVLSQNEHPAVLKDRVASPGGTTMAGLAELERLGLRAALMAAVAAATKRSRELGS